MESDRKGVIALHWEDELLRAIATEPRPLVPHHAVTITELVTFVIYGTPITASELLELSEGRRDDAERLDDEAAQNVYHALSAALLAGEISIWGMECLDEDAERSTGETIEDLLKIRIGGLVGTAPPRTYYPREIPREQLMRHWLHRLYSNRLVADPVECYQEGRLAEMQWRDVKLLPHHAEVVLKRLNATAPPDVSTPLLRRKPGPKGDGDYIRKYAAIAFPNGVPVGMSKQEARNRIIAEMAKAKNNGENMRTPDPKTFGRHGY